MRERGPDASQEPRHSPRHPELLAPRRQVQCLHPVGHELRAARDRREAKVVGDVGQDSEQLLHIGLVAGPAAAEHVRVDHDERLRHPAASR